MRILIAAEILALAKTLGREDLLRLWQACPDCGGPTTAAYWRSQGDPPYAPAGSGLICPTCPDLPEHPIKEWAYSENGPNGAQ